MESKNSFWDTLRLIFSHIMSLFLPESFQSSSSAGHVGAKSKPTVAVIGSGYSGLCAAIQAKKRFGIKPQVFEASAEIGGTWWHNQYPGCACDIPSHLYSFSFDMNPSWTHTYSPQAEILEYLKKVATKYGIYEQTLLNTEVIRATWLDEKKQWKLDYRHKSKPDQVKTGYYDIVFAALGPLRIVNMPDQYKSFEGPIVHTAFWDNKINFNDKKVAIIGSGASAVQVLPELQKVASKIISYQRSPVWIVDRGQYEIPTWMHTLFKWCPPLMHLQRVVIFFFNEALFPVVFKSAKSRLAKAARWYLSREMRNRLDAKGHRDLAHIVIPDYPVGCKRICRSENYLEALCEDNVIVKKGHIKEVKGRSIVHEDGSVEEVDVLVLATGFDIRGFLGNLEIYGRNNQLLTDIWKDDYPSTLRSTSIHGYPNLFLLLGPNSGLGHNSAVTMIEILVDYAMRSMDYMMKNEIAALEAKKESQDQFVAKMKKEIKGTSWTGSCASWYKNDKGEFYVLWPGTITYFFFHMMMKDSQYSLDYIEHRRKKN